MTFFGPHQTTLQYQGAIRRRARYSSIYLIALLLSWPTASAFAVLPDKQPPKSSPSSGSGSFSKLAKRSFSAEKTTQDLNVFDWGCVAKITFSRQLKFDASGSKGEYRLEGQVLEVTFDQSDNLAQIKKIEEKWSSTIKNLLDVYQEAGRIFQRTNERSSAWQARYDDVKEAENSLKEARADRDKELAPLKRRPADCREQSEKWKGSKVYARSLFEISGDRFIYTIVESAGIGVATAGTQGSFEFQSVGDGEYVRLNSRIFRRQQ